MSADTISVVKSRKIFKSKILSKIFVFHVFSYFSYFRLKFPSFFTPMFDFVHLFCNISKVRLYECSILANNKINYSFCTRSKIMKYHHPYICKFNFSDNKYQFDTLGYGWIINKHNNG